MKTLFTQHHRVNTIDKRVTMSAEMFESISLVLGITILIGFMFFIIYDLGKKSGAGKFGMAILFIALGTGMVGFLIKIILIDILGMQF